MSPSFRTPAVRHVSLRRCASVLLVTALPLIAAAAGPVTTPASKVFVSDLHGSAQIDTGEKIHELSRRSVYNAEGTIIETKPAADPAVQAKDFATMVYSNGTGAYFDPDTRLELKRFEQEPFTPTRTDFDVEPSISQTQAFLARGTVGLCTSKLVAGSSMVYQTQHAAVTILGRKVVIEASPEQTKISMIEGESSIRGGTMDTGGHTLRAGEQAVITRGPAGQPNLIRVSEIPPAEARALNEKVTLACMAKRTVYFDVREAGEGAGEPTTAAIDAAAPSANNVPGIVRAFYGNTATPPASTREIVALPVVPANLPVPFVVSPANLPAPGR